MPVLMDMSSQSVATWVDSGGTTVLMGLGQVVEHGAHLPVGADVWKVDEVVHRTSAKMDAGGLEILAAPTVQFGYIPSHLEFAGHLHVSHETLVRLLTDIGYSFQRQGFRSLVILSAGAENWGPLGTAAFQLAQEFGNDFRIHGVGLFELLTKTAAHLVQSKGPYDLKGGELQTSLVMAINPDTVDMAKAEPYYSERLKLMGELPFAGMNAHRFQLATADWSNMALSESGVFGDPSLASAEEGDAALELASDALVEFLTTWVINKSDSEDS